MCEIIPFHGVKHRRRNVRQHTSIGEAQILPFTGIQYVREEEIETSQPVKRRTRKPRKTNSGNVGEKSQLLRRRS